MLQYNKSLRQFYSESPPKNKNKINWTALDKSKESFKLLTESRKKENLNYLEKQFGIMVNNMNQEKFQKIISFNIEEISKNLK